MYCTLHQRFQGAFLGCAIARAKDTTDDPLMVRLVHRSQIVQQIQFYETVEIATTGIQSIVDTLLISLMCHDNDQERFAQLAGISDVTLMFSEAIAARLQRQMPQTSDHTALAKTITEAIHQQLPLQSVASAILAFPDLSPLDQAIALALYCWRCTPEHFTIPVQRSHQLLRYCPDHQWITLTPVITGILSGASIGSGSLVHQGDCHSKILQIASRLFCVWAGIHPSSDCASLDELVISQSGQLKPRSFEHLTFDSDYS